MEYTSVLEILSSSKISGRLSPFKPCVHCCRLCQMTAVATPLSPPFGDSGRQGREVVTFVEGRSPSQNLWSMCILCAYAIMTTQSIISETAMAMIRNTIFFKISLIDFFQSSVRSLYDICSRSVSTSLPSFHL